MAKETLEELRERLLRQHNVQQMIQARAYEIYQMRGGQPGREAQDWFHAESEVLAFLLADESAQDQARPDAGTAASSSDTAATADHPATRKTKSGARRRSSEAKEGAPKKPAAKRAISKKTAQPKSKPARGGSKSKTEKTAD